MGCSWLRALARKSAEYPFVGMLRAFFAYTPVMCNGSQLKKEKEFLPLRSTRFRYASPGVDF